VNIVARQKLFAAMMVVLWSVEESGGKRVGKGR
jgi:hypothetical protein